MGFVFAGSPQSGLHLHIQQLIFLHVSFPFSVIIAFLTFSFCAYNCVLSYSDVLQSGGSVRCRSGLAGTLLQGLASHPPADCLLPG